MLHEIYYCLTTMIFRPQLQKMGNKCRLRMKGRFLHGKFVHLGDEVGIEKGFVIAVYPTFGGKINPVADGTSGRGVWLERGGSYNRYLTIYCADTVRIGKDVLFGSGVLVTDNEHGTNPESEIPYRDQPLKTAPVYIGDRCWIAEDVKILAGSHIGAESIVAAGAVVKGVFPKRCILAGVPAKVVRVWDFDRKEWIKPEERKTGLNELSHRAEK